MPDTFAGRQRVVLATGGLITILAALIIWAAIARVMTSFDEADKYRPPIAVEQNELGPGQTEIY